MPPKTVAKKTAPKTKKESPKTASKPKAPAKKAPAPAKKKTATVKKAAPITKKAAPVTKKLPLKKVAVAPKKKATKSTAPAGMPEQLRDAALKVLDEKKADAIVCVDLRGRSAVADYALIATGGSARQLGAIAEYLREAFFKLGMKKIRVEGLPQGDWVLIDAGDVLVHLFRPEVREYYQLEDIWSARSPSVL